ERRSDDRRGEARPAVRAPAGDRVDFFFFFVFGFAQPVGRIGVVDRDAAVGVGIGRDVGDSAFARAADRAPVGGLLLPGGRGEDDAAATPARPRAVPHRLALPRAGDQ